MSTLELLQGQFEYLEQTTVSNSFGGPALGGKAPSYTFKPIMDWFVSELPSLQLEDVELFGYLQALKGRVSDSELLYIINSISRFAFLIELTNLRITSTKLKTRWVPGRIMKTRLLAYENYEGLFEPGEDQRSSNFPECLNIFKKCLSLLVNSEEHLNVAKKLSNGPMRSVPYESVFTYENYSIPFVHSSNNVRLAQTNDVNWLIQARPIIQPIMRRDSSGVVTNVVQKISTKSYKTDRSQTGEVQTNRAKRWECLSTDFQHATLEECWSVERKLLEDITHFNGFPENAIQQLTQLNLHSDGGPAVCPITFKPLQYIELLGGSSHGESKYQVGHLIPLKAQGRHRGDNIAWISDDGNRIQGSLNIQDTRNMLRGIFNRMGDRNLL